MAFLSSINAKIKNLDLLSMAIRAPGAYEKMSFV